MTLYKISPVKLYVVQNNMERSESETRMRLTQQIQKMERDNTVWRKKAEGTDEEQKAFVTTLEVLIVELSYVVKTRFIDNYDNLNRAYSFS